MPVGWGYLGRIVNGLGAPLDGAEAVKPDERLPLFGEAPGITARAALTRPLLTGTKVIDAVIPIAKGQRELIIGDRVTGKTTLAVDAILSQRGRDVLCIYCCIGRGRDFLEKLARLLRDRGAMGYSVIVGSTADAPVGEQYLAPYAAASLGEFFMRQGKDVLVVFDDLSKHAWVYRQIALLMDRSPGREAYPGDIFYVHSQLVERAAQLKPELGGGSMTFLPIVETQQGDLTGYISSNLISMTDGQIYLTTELFQEGMKPAIDMGLSVSRIGNKIQCPAMRLLCATLRLEFVQYKELLNVTKLRSNISRDAQAKLIRGQAIAEALKQGKNEPVGLAEQVATFRALRLGLLDDMLPRTVQEFKRGLGSFLAERRPDLLEALSGEPAMTESLRDALDSALRGYAAPFLPAAAEEGR
jgi:F-type H+-transporting ATPase subunit alpha